MNYKKSGKAVVQAWTDYRKSNDFVGVSHSIPSFVAGFNAARQPVIDIIKDKLKSLKNMNHEGFYDFQIDFLESLLDIKLNN